MKGISLIAFLFFFTSLVAQNPLLYPYTENGKTGWTTVDGSIRLPSSDLTVE